MKRFLIPGFIAMALILIGCRTSDYCTVKGSIKGFPDGTKLELQDFWNHCKVVGTATVKNGAVVFHPDVAAPTHVFLYKGDLQLQDFFLEPGTVTFEVDAADGDNYMPGAAGTPSNDAFSRFIALKVAGRDDAVEALVDSVFSAAQTGPLAIRLADSGYKSAFESLEALNRLSPELADIAFVQKLKEEFALLAKTEPRDGFKPQFIDLEYANADGKRISLGSVVQNPKNRYVLLDFWATWCGPCVRYLPKMKEAYKKYHGKGLEIYSVSVDSDEKAWKSFLKKNGMDWISVRDDLGGRRSSKVWENYAITTIPMFILIDGNTGEILFRENHPDLDEVFSELLK